MCTISVFFYFDIFEVSLFCVILNIISTLLCFLCNKLLLLALLPNETNNNTCRSRWIQWLINCVFVMKEKKTSQVVEKPIGLVLDENLSQAWRYLKQKFELYLEASKNQDEDLDFKSALLLISIGDRGFRIFRSLQFDGDVFLRRNILPRGFSEVYWQRLFILIYVICGNPLLANWDVSAKWEWCYRVDNFSRYK